MTRCTPSAVTTTPAFPWNREVPPPDVRSGGPEPAPAHQRTDRPTEPWAPIQLFLKAIIPLLTRARLWAPV